MSLLLLVAVTLLLIWYMRNDLAEYAAFKQLTRTEDRQRTLRRWTLRSFLLFAGSATASLLILGRLDTLLHLPPEFAGLSARIRGLFSETGGSGFLIGVAGGIAGAAILAGAFAASRAKRGSPPADPAMAGDIASLLPRNREERTWTGLLAANSGPSEEIFFRLVLPLLLATVTGNALLAFLLAAAMFGVAHLYQGWIGVIATTLAGLLFTGVYLATGNIWIAALLHSLLNLQALWLRPLLRERRTGKV